MPKITQINEQQYPFPIGIAYISSALKVTGRNVYTLNLNYKKDDTRLLINRAINENGIDVVAFGGISPQYGIIKSILDTVKQVKPSVITVIGGGIITSDPVHAMMALENADYGVVGEGEITICELAYALENETGLSKVDGIVFKAEDGKWIVTGTRSDIEDLDIIPWPDYDGFEYDRILPKTPIDIIAASSSNDRVGLLYFGRSCPYNCTFCFHSSGKKYRTRSISSFFDEFDVLMKKYAFTQVHFCDECFIKNIDFISEFCATIKSYSIKWQCSSRVDNITREMLEMMKDAGLIAINLGVESADNNILKSMRKNITREQIENAFILCHEVGIAPQGNLIFGDLEETFETAMNSISWWKEHQDWALTMHWIFAYPGTHIYKVSCERGIIPDPVQYIQNGCPEINFSKMTDTERRQIALRIEMSVNEKHEILSGATISQGQLGKLRLDGSCPYCGSECTFFNIDLIRPIYLEVCKSCNKTLRLFGLDYIDPSIFSRNIKSILASHKIAFWPVVTGVAKLLELSSELTNENVFFVDSSQFKQGMKIHNKTIQNPKVIRELGIDTVFITVTTVISQDIMNDIRLNYPCVKRLEPVGNLFF